jgi:hypothetical protein
VKEKGEKSKDKGEIEVKRAKEWKRGGEANQVCEK